MIGTFVVNLLHLLLTLAIGLSLVQLYDWTLGSSDQQDEPTAHRLSYPDLDAGEEYAGVIEISEEDEDS